MGSKATSGHDRPTRGRFDRWSELLRAAHFSLPPRDRDEPNRSSTPLELLFDLATVLAVAAAAFRLAHDVNDGEYVEGIATFACNFFMIWLAWSNYTWFASGYDNKSTAFRALSMVITFGSLALAGGILSDRGDQPIWLALLGFSIMRSGLIVLWLGAARGDEYVRPTARRYAVGIGLMQLYWYLLIVAVPPQAAQYLPLFALGAAGELAIPALATRTAPASWHHDHIIDRHNLFNIIVLGECFAAIAEIIADSETPELADLWLPALCCIIVFCMWRLYFDRNEQLSARRLRTVLAWAYGHCVLFAAGAATAAGFSVFLAIAHDRSAILGENAALAINIPVALYLAALWLVRDRVFSDGFKHWLLLIAAGLVLLTSVCSAQALELVTVVLVFTVWSSKAPARTGV
jgi:low temperature requirement protein LtrA